MSSSSSIFCKYRGTKKFFRCCKLKLFNSHHAKWIATLLILYVLGTIYYVKIYVINQTDPNIKYCENAFENRILEERSRVDKELHRRLSNASSKTLPKSNEQFVVAYEHIFLYSAFLDNSDPPPQLQTEHYIKIVSIVLQDLGEHYLPNPMCKLRVQNKIFANESAIIVHLPEGHGCCYTAAFIFCPFSSSVLPTHVSVTIGSSVPQWIAVESLLKEPVTNNEITVCVRPFYGTDFSIVQLAEFISHHHNLGINHFQFYNASVPYTVQRFLNMLQNDMSISLLQWNVPLKSLLVHEMGQLAFIQDCVLRWQSRVEYVLILDLDELLVPQNSPNIRSMLIDLQHDNPSASAFIIPSVVFCDEYLPKSSNPKYPIPFSSLYNDQRQLTPWPHQIRSKYIVYPRHISVAGIHQVWKSVQYFTPVNIHAKEMVIHHYRTCCNLNQPWFLMLMEFSVLNDAIKTDKTVTKTADAIIGCQVYKVLQKIMQHHI